MTEGLEALKELVYGQELIKGTDVEKELYKTVENALKEKEKQEQALRIIKEKRVNVRCLMSGWNLGKYNSAIREFATVYKQDPKDFVIEYYLDLAKKIENKQLSEKILPLKYLKEIPNTKYILAYSNNFNLLNLHSTIVTEQFLCVIVQKSLEGLLLI